MSLRARLTCGAGDAGPALLQSVRLIRSNAGPRVAVDAKTSLRLDRVVVNEVLRVTELWGQTR